MSNWLVENLSDLELELRTYARPHAPESQITAQQAQHTQNKKHNTSQRNTKRKKKATAQHKVTIQHNYAKIGNTHKEQ